MMGELLCRVRARELEFRVGESKKLKYRVKESELEFRVKESEL